MTAHISVQNLSKTYRVPVRDAGLLASVKSLWKGEYKNVEAVKDITFSVEEGEIVGFLGPNGAGKTTTLKMLSGLLYPTTGEIQVAGFTPHKRDYDYLSRITMVMGNKGQLSWELPPLDSFRLLGDIYRVPRSQIKQRIDELIDLLDLQELINKPMRNMSLGERMKCELAALLIYRPQVLFLDEPTLGLDVSMQRRLRAHFTEYNRLTSATIILTSHYMADVEALCSRIVMIHHGSLIYDGSLQGLARRFAPYKIVAITFDDENEDSNQRAEHKEYNLPDGIEVLEKEPGKWKLRVNQPDIAAVTAHLLNSWSITDLSIEEPSIETVIDTVYQEGAVVC